MAQSYFIIVSILKKGEVGVKVEWLTVTFHSNLHRTSEKDSVLGRKSRVGTENTENIHMHIEVIKKKASFGLHCLHG